MSLGLQIKIITYSTQVDNCSHGCTSHLVFMGSTSELLNMILMAVGKEVEYLKKGTKVKGATSAAASGTEAGCRCADPGLKAGDRSPASEMCCSHGLPLKADTGPELFFYSPLYLSYLNNCTSETHKKLKGGKIKKHLLVGSRL